MSWKCYGVNPFIVNYEKHVSLRNRRVGKVKSSSQEVLDVDTGEVNPMYYYVVEKHMIDKQGYLKLFHEGLDLLVGLNAPGFNVLLYVMKVLYRRKDYVYIDMGKCMTYCRYRTSKSVYNGLHELIDRGVLAASEETNKFFINPAVFFNGERIAKK